MALGDTGADAQLSTVIQSIEHRLKIVRKIAAKQAAKKKPQADAIGEARMENRIRTQFHQQLTEQLSEANRKLSEAMESPLISRLGISKPQRNSWSNPEQLGLRWKVQSGTQLASDMPCPFPIDDCGLTLQIHESVVGNLLDPVLAGRILRSDEIDAYAAQFGDAAKGIPRKEEDGPWAITLNNFQPVETVFDDNLIKFRVTTSRLEREDQALPNTATVEAAYKIVQADGTIQLERQGDLNVEFAGKVQQGTRGVVLRTFLKNKFEQLFREKLFDSPIRWSDRLPDQFKDLQLCAVGIDDGWLQLQIR
jgi:chorismate mutase